MIVSLREDRCRLLYVSPERLVGEGSQGFRRMLQQCGVRFVAIDEAHCISQWGHDFRPEYRQLGCLRDDFPGRLAPRLHGHRDRARAARHRGGAPTANPSVLVGSFDRPNLTYRVLRRSNLHRQLLQILERHENEAGIVYCSSRREVESLAEWLRGEGHQAVPYHAGLPDAVRARHQEEFLDERVDIVVATVAFGMGIDRSNVRFVVHAGAPRSPEHYQQESGRAGRDGLPAECVLIVLRRRLRALAADARVERRVDRQRTRRCCATWSGTPQVRDAGIDRWSSISVSPTSEPSAERATGA